jgi:hypothetical protein
MAAVHGTTAHLCVCVACHTAHGGAPLMARCPVCQQPVQEWLVTDG